MILFCSRINHEDTFSVSKETKQQIEVMQSELRRLQTDVLTLQSSDSVKLGMIKESFIVF